MYITAPNGDVLKVPVVYDFQYVLRHNAVNKLRGKASERKCQYCAVRQAYDWATVHGTDGQDVFSDYIPLCRPCHRSYDSPRTGYRRPRSTPTGRTQRGTIFTEDILRQIIDRHDVEGVTYTEIAREYNASGNTLRSAISRYKKRMNF